MVFEKFTIILNRSSGNYNAGEEITGSVLTVLNKPFKLRGITLELYGKGIVEWEEDDDGIGYRPTFYSNGETYVESVIILFGKGYKTRSDQIQLSEGEHKFPFKFTLPVNIPPSFEHKYGSIKYHLKAIIDKPWMPDKTCKIPIQVNTILDLNTLHEAKLPIKNIITKNLGCLSCTSGSLTASIKIDQTGYIPGERVSFHAEIENSSKKTITSTKLTLEMKMMFRVSKKTKVKKVSLSSVNGISLKPGNCGTWSGKIIEIPPQTTPQLTYSSIIDVEYTLKYLACSLGCANEDSDWNRSSENLTSMLANNHQDLPF